MTKTELRPLYVEACTRARVKPTESELAVWFSKLGQFDIADLKAAIDAHFEKSQWMPKDSELRPLAEHAKRGRQGQASSRTTFARYRCPDCFTTKSGFIEPIDFTPRRCKSPYRNIADRKPHDASLPAGQICGALMVEIFREDNFKTGNARTEDDWAPDPRAKSALPEALMAKGRGAA